MNIRNINGAYNTLRWLIRNNKANVPFRIGCYKDRDCIILYTDRGDTDVVYATESRACDTILQDLVKRSVGKDIYKDLPGRRKITALLTNSLDRMKLHDCNYTDRQFFHMTRYSFINGDSCDQCKYGLLHKHSNSVICLNCGYSVRS